MPMNPYSQGRTSFFREMQNAANRTISKAPEGEKDAVAHRVESRCDRMAFAILKRMEAEKRWPRYKTQDVEADRLAYNITAQRLLSMAEGLRIMIDWDAA